MINSTSRYRDSTVTKVTGPDGTLQRALVPGVQDSFTVNFTYYQWRLSDRVDILATAFFADPTQWWNIADANPEILDWTEVAPGTVIRVPSV